MTNHIPPLHQTLIERIEQAIFDFGNKKEQPLTSGWSPLAYHELLKDVLLVLKSEYGSRGIDSKQESEMSPEYQKIVDYFVCSENYSTNATKFVVWKCELLAKETHAALEKRIAELSDEVAAYERKANKPVRELTDDEIRDAYGKKYSNLHDETFRRIRQVIAAHIAKQNEPDEPDEIPFDQAKFDGGGWVVRVIGANGLRTTYYAAAKVALVRADRD